MQKWIKVRQWLLFLSSNEEYKLQYGRISDVVFQRVIPVHFYVIP